MKKALVIFFALSLVSGVFAAELVADLDSESSKSATSSGIWGELPVKQDGDLNFTLDTPQLLIDKAQPNFGVTYLGIKTVFDRNDDFDYSHAMTYEEGFSLAEALNYRRDSAIVSGNIVVPTTLMVLHGLQAILNIY